MEIQDDTLVDYIAGMRIPFPILDYAKEGTDEYVREKNAHEMVKTNSSFGPVAISFYKVLGWTKSPQLYACVKIVFSVLMTWHEGKVPIGQNQDHQ